MEYLSRFDFSITYVKGISNKVADSFSRYHQSDTDADKWQTYEYVNADLRLDPEGEDLPWGRIVEIRAMAIDEDNRQIREQTEDREIEAKRLAEASRKKRPVENNSRQGENPTIFEAISEGPDLTTHLDQVHYFLDNVKKGYESDSLFANIIAKPLHHPTFSYREGFLYSKNQIGKEVLCIPRVVTKDASLTGTVIEQAHNVLGHFGSQRTADYIRHWYWWPKLGQGVEKFCRTCVKCHTSKTTNSKPAGLLHSRPIPLRPWGSIGMDFVGPFPESKGFDYLWVVICRLTLMVHLVPIKTTTKASELAWLYVTEVVHSI
jgi:hypothetical protein